MLINKYHHPNSAIKRFTLPRLEGGRNLKDINNLSFKPKNTLHIYFLQKQEVSQMHKSIVEADKEYLLGNVQFVTISEDEKRHLGCRKQCMVNMLMNSTRQQ